MGLVHNTIWCSYMDVIELSSATMVDKKYEYIVVLPLGSTEYHFDKLPFGVDTFIADKLAKLLIHSIDKESDNYKVLLLPVLPYGSSIEWLEWPGTISIKLQTYYEFISDIIESLERRLRIKGYIIVNGHGGNYSIIERYAQWFWNKYHKPFIIIDIWRAAGDLGLKYCHACCTEIKLYNALNNIASDEKCIDNPVEHSGLRGRYSQLSAGAKGYVELHDLVEYLKQLFAKAIAIIADSMQS